MSRNVRLFPTYSQAENQTTNHCLLILKMLYEENPNFLSEALSNLLTESFSGTVGVQFMQQKGNKSGIPDGEITQEPFSILVETKLGCNFDKQQLLRHLKTLKQKKYGQKVLLALGNFPQDIPTHPDFPKVEQQAQECEVMFLPISFEQFLESIQVPHISRNLADAISSLEEYFDENDLLPSWKYRLDVVNCRNSFDSVIKHQIYTCPAKAGHYSHQRSLYFGTYRHKCVEQIAKITAVIDFESPEERNLL